MNPLDLIRIKQRSASLLTVDRTVPEHNPKALYLGCIKAPFDSIRDLGMPLGYALIHRTLDAEVYGVSASGLAIDISEAASLEFAVKGKNVQRIIIGLPDDYTGATPGAEKDALLQRMQTLRSYDFIDQRVKQGTLEIVAWLLKPGTGQVLQLNPQTGELEPIELRPEQPPYSPLGSKHNFAKEHSGVYYEGCIDARLDPFMQVGLHAGSFIERGIAAAKFGLDEDGKPYRPNEARNLEYVVNDRKVGLLIFSGHSNCGGMDCCIKGVDEKTMPHVHRYLLPFSDLRAEILSKGSDHDTARAELEKAVVRRTIKKVFEYPFIKGNKNLVLSGLVMDTATKLILELDFDDVKDIDKAEFKPMGRVQKYR